MNRRDRTLVHAMGVVYVALALVDGYRGHWWSVGFWVLFVFWCAVVLWTAKRIDETPVSRDGDRML